MYQIKLAGSFRTGAEFLSNQFLPRSRAVESRGLINIVEQPRGALLYFLRAGGRITLLGTGLGMITGYHYNIAFYPLASSDSGREPASAFSASLQDLPLISVHRMHARRTQDSVQTLLGTVISIVFFPNGT